MTPRLPGALCVAQGCKQFAALYLMLRQFGQEGASPARADELIYLGEELCGKNDVCACASHGVGNKVL
ncbi:MAG: hypothetical protein EPN33_03330 [Acidobacteria bacterium]|nr:MAG: hypothetical protein EPN33_03330 [Acidobacteriota bacterium]